MPKQLRAFLIDLSRPAKRAVLALADICLLLFAVWAAYSLRLGEWFVPNARQAMLMAAAPVIALPVFVRVGLYRSVIRYLGEEALWAIVRAMTIAAAIWTALAFLTQMSGLTGLPRSIPLLYWLLGIVLIGGLRFAARWMLWLPLRLRYRGQQVLIFGAGSAGRQLAASLRQGNGFFPAGFLDDDADLQGKDIQGLRVYAPEGLPALIKRFDIHDVIVTLPSSSVARRREVVSFLEQYRLRVRILPALADIASGRHLVNMVREVDVGDLLGRDAVEPDPALLGQCITGRSVLVTGAGGSIGAELCRQVAAQKPKTLVLLERSEHALYQIERSLRHAAPCPVVARLGSVSDAALVAGLLAEHGIETVYHAAAYKHVPIVEHNLIEGVHNNVLCTRTLARAAFEAGVGTFVLISTDKAVRPTNVMGATKRWAELVVQSYGQKAAALGRPQRFCAVRFGNVLGSSGSVIPLFREQITAGGPVTVTHPEVTRYFMSIDEAVELVIQAGSLAQDGEIFLLDMGEPVKIVDLAKRMIRLAGHSVRDEQTPEGDIEIVFSGLRPGEKLYEEMLISSHNAQGTGHPRIMKASEPSLGVERLQALLAELEQTLEVRNSAAARELLMRVAAEPLEPAEAPGESHRSGPLRLAHPAASAVRVSTGSTRTE